VQEKTPLSVWEGIKPQLTFETVGGRLSPYWKGMQGYIGGIVATIEYLAERPTMAVLDKEKGTDFMIGLMQGEVVEVIAASQKDDRESELADVMVFGILTVALHWQEIKMMQRIEVLLGIVGAAKMLERSTGSTEAANRALYNVAKIKDSDNYPAEEFKLDTDEGLDDMMERTAMTIAELHGGRYAEGGVVVAE